jgi:IMP dehydrogenase/GMP reductase
MSEQINLSGLDYKDVYIVPQYSEIETRSQVDIGVTVGSRTTWHLDVPVISSNMDTVTEHDMATAMFRAGASGAIHRFMSISDNVGMYNKIRTSNTEAFVSVGVNRDSKERTQELYKAGARYFVIDIAHGHSKMMKEMIAWVKGEYRDVFLMAGNVATTEGAFDLARWGADAIKVGIGPGAVCLTKNVTGVTVPQLGAVQACALAEQLWYVGNQKEFPLIVADGGIREYGDVAKAIAAGADMVMIGGMFAGTDEAPGELVGGKKVYRGMASRDAMRVIRVGDSMPTPEGTSVLVDSKGPVGQIVQDIAGGLRSAFSYSNSRNIKDFQKRAQFGIKRR